MTILRLEPLAGLQSIDQCGPVVPVPRSGSFETALNVNQLTAATTFNLLASIINQPSHPRCIHSHRLPPPVAANTLTLGNLSRFPSKRRLSTDCSGHAVGCAPLGAATQTVTHGDDPFLGSYMAHEFAYAAKVRASSVHLPQHRPNPLLPCVPSLPSQHAPSTANDQG